MKSVAKGFVATALCLAAAAAAAGDLPSRLPPALPEAPTLDDGPAGWTGFYVGASSGYSSWTGGRPRPQSGSAGLRGGYDMDLGNDFVIGIVGEAELNFGADHSFVRYQGADVNVTTRQRYAFTLDARAGYAVEPDTLFYLLGGYTHGDVKAASHVAAVASAEAIRIEGWNVGAGLEHRFSTSLSGFAEYRFHKVNTSGRANINQMKLGANVRF